MSERASRRREPLLDRLAFVLGVFLLACLASVVLLQVAYRVFPAQPSAAVLRLEKEATQRPFLFENGYRLAGLLAPDGMDPVAVGRCIFPDVQERAQALKAGTEPKYTSREEGKARQAACMQGLPALLLAPAIADAKASPDWRLADWLSLSQETPDPRLLDRARVLWTQGHTRLGTDFDRHFADSRPLTQLAQWLLASAVQQWHDGRHQEALETWASVAEHAMGATGDDFVETMGSIGVLSRWLLSLQTALGSTQSLDSTTADRAMALLSLMDPLPQALQRSMISEWHGTVQSRAHFGTSVHARWNEKTDADNRMAFYWLGLIFDALYDPVDTINLATRDLEIQRQQLVNLAQGRGANHRVSRSPCPWLGPIEHACLPLERNPLGRYLLRTNPAEYVPYGTRVADLRNLAAATRLTIEARRQGLTGEALARFIASAPEGMRDVFTQQAFAYAAEQRKLGIVLRGKSPVLGEPRTYELDL